MTSLIVELMSKIQPAVLDTRSMIEHPVDFANGHGYGFTQRQSSSYSRTSKTPGNDDWFANDDYGHYVRQEGKEYVISQPHGYLADVL